MRAHKTANMQQRLSAITLGVQSIARSRAFYKALGWTPAQAQEGVVFYQMSGFIVALYGAKDLLDDIGINELGRPGAITLAYNVRTPEEVQPLLERAAGAGGRVVKPAQTVFWGGHSGYFADPDGHLWEVAHNPFWTIDDQGRLTIDA